VTERIERPMGSKKTRQVKQLTNAVSLEMVQLRIEKDGGNNNNLHSAKDEIFKTVLLKQMCQMNAQMQE